MYFSFFSPIERVPFAFLFMKSRKNFVDFLAFYDQDIFVGFAYLITHKDLTFILYIAVQSVLQAKGYGSQILKYIQNLYPGHRFILDIQAIYENAAQLAQRKKRRDFYIKNGFIPAGFIWKEKHEIFEVLTYGGSCSIQEFQALIQKFTGPLLYKLFKPQFQPIEQL